jgi:hypothetical protein
MVGLFLGLASNGSKTHCSGQGGRAAERMTGHATSSVGTLGASGPHQAGPFQPPPAQGKGGDESNRHGSV